MAACPHVDITPICILPLCGGLHWCGVQGMSTSHDCLTAGVGVSHTHCADNMEMCFEESLIMHPRMFLFCLHASGIDYVGLLVT